MLHDQSGLNESAKDYEAYSLRPSLWDTAVFAGSPYIGCLSSMVIILCIILQLIMTGIFLGVLNSVFVIPAYDSTTVVAFGSWRAAVGQFSIEIA